MLASSSRIASRALHRHPAALIRPSSSSSSLLSLSLLSPVVPVRAKHRLKRKVKTPPAIPLTEEEKAQIKEDLRQRARLRLLEPDFYARIYNKQPTQFYKQLLEYCFPFEGSAVGQRVTRKRYAEQQPEPCFWTITRVEWDIRTLRFKRGKVYGRKTWRGVEDPEERLVRGMYKPDWMRYEYVNARWNDFKAPEQWKRPQPYVGRPAEEAPTLPTPVAAPPA